MTIRPCRTAADFDQARRLVRDYVAWLGMDLSFQHVDDEFAAFETMYGPPGGVFLVAVTKTGELAGGAGLRRLDPRTAEMKRLYVYDPYRRRGLGRRLCEELLRRARAYGYAKVRLDTVARLVEANALYEGLGFRDIPPYRPNPDPTARFMERAL
jgi:ribosomal protein S18 acetylase RimI-like enzyme